MAMPSDLNKGKFLEWYTELPFENRHRNSPTFLIQYTEFYFNFSTHSSTYYLCLFPKMQTTCRKLESFSFVIYSDHRQTGNFIKSPVTYSGRENIILHFANTEIINRGPNLRNGYIVRFFFMFKSEDGSMLQLETKTDDKSTQTPSYTSRFRLEDTSKDFAKLFDEGPNHDVEITVGDQIMKAHKNILCCRSTVFASMLQTNMVEGKTGRINIQDIDATIFTQFLRYLYTGILPELTVDTAVQLYKASNKYAVDILKKQCGEILLENLSLENACEILVLADLHNDPDLKQSIMEYIFKEEIPVVVEEKWSEFCTENQKLAVEALNLFYRQFRGKSNFLKIDPSS